MFFTFADGLPGFGLLLLRIAVGTALVVRCLRPDHGALPYTILHVIAAGAGMFLLFGAWTRLAGVMVAIIESVIAFSHNSDPWVSVLLASLGVALALLGPATWSVDARRFGWKRIEIRRPDE